METVVRVFIAAFLAVKAAGSPEPCDVNHGNLLSTYQLFENGSLNDPTQGIFYPPGSYFMNNGQYRTCPCKIGTIPCLRKCCPIGMSFGMDGECTPNKEGHVFWINVTTDDDRNTIAVNAAKHFALLTTRYCPSNSTYFLEPDTYFEDEYFIRSSDGILTTPHHSTDEFGVDHFCIDYFSRTGENRVLVCSPEDFLDQTESRRITSVVYPILMLISVPPLLLTFQVYAFIPQLRNLHGKCLICYVLCLMFSYIFLAISHLGLDTIPVSGCMATAFLSLFSLLGAFFWLNVMCIDICLTYCVRKQSPDSAHENERKKFIIYSAYAWSCTFLIFIISLIMDTAPGIPEHYLKPRFGRSRCWFDRKIEAFLFFYGPFSLLITCNIIMYIVTAVKMYKQKREMMKMNDPQHRTRVEKDNKIRFKLYLKLLLIMGIIWITELIGWAVDGPDYYWYLADVINCLQGVLIFIIFVWQKRVRKIVILKLCPQVKERQSTGWSFFDRCCMVHKLYPNRTSEAGDTSSSAILSPPKDNILLKPIEETTKMNVGNNEEV